MGIWVSSVPICKGTRPPPFSQRTGSALYFLCLQRHESGDSYVPVHHQRPLPYRPLHHQQPIPVCEQTGILRVRHQDRSARLYVPPQAQQTQRVA